MKDNMKPIFKAATTEQINKRPKHEELLWNEDIVYLLSEIKRRMLSQKFYECMEVK